MSLRCPLATAGQLALLAGVAAYDAVASFLPYEARSDLLLKWPNDLLFREEKIAGVLLESAAVSPLGGCKVVIGTGINLASHPEDLSPPATSLAALGTSAAPAAALEALAACTQAWIARWEEGTSFAAIRHAWLHRAGPTGRPIKVRVGDEQETEGTFAGLDAGGALRLVTSDGAERRIAAGDVFFMRS